MTQFKVPQCEHIINRGTFVWLGEHAGKYNERVCPCKSWTYQMVNTLLKKVGTQRLLAAIVSRQGEESLCVWKVWTRMECLRQMTCTNDMDSGTLSSINLWSTSRHEWFWIHTCRPMKALPYKSSTCTITEKVRVLENNISETNKQTNKRPSS